MFEQSHRSHSLEMDANEILSANLSRGARVRGRGIAGAVAALAVLAAAVGIGIYTLGDRGLETDSSEVYESVATTTSVYQPDVDVIEQGEVSKTANVNDENGTANGVCISLTNNAGVGESFDITDEEICEGLRSFAEDFVSSPYMDFEIDELKEMSKDEYLGYIVSFTDLSSGYYVEIYPCEGDIIVVRISYSDDVCDNLYLDANKHTKLMEYLTKCETLGRQLIEKRMLTDKLNLKITFTGKNSPNVPIDLEKYNIDYDKISKLFDGFYSSFENNTLPEGVTVAKTEVDRSRKYWFLISSYFYLN